MGSQEGFAKSGGYPNYAIPGMELAIVGAHSGCSSREVPQLFGSRVFDVLGKRSRNPESSTLKVLGGPWIIMDYPEVVLKS